MLPRVAIHADWSTDPAKRWMAIAVRRGDGFEIGPPELVGDVRGLIDLARMRARGGGALLGFDFPIGVPDAYATRAGILRFPDALVEFGTGRWRNFYCLASSPSEISLERPFYPERPGGTRQADLVLGLGMGNMRDLMRRCEQHTVDRHAACALFWLVGANQVGRAAMSGWREMLAPALRARGSTVGIWPFDGDLATLVRTRECVVAETYPADACVQLGLPAPGRGWSKRDQEDRARQAEPLASWARSRPIALTADLPGALADGFGDAPTGEDAFDAVVGLFAMIDVLLGNRPEGVPPNPRVRAVEGWILGQSATALV